MEAVTITQVLGDEAVCLVRTSRRSDQAHPVPPWRIVGVRSAICLRPSPGLPPIETTWSSLIDQSGCSSGAILTDRLWG